MTWKEQTPDPARQHWALLDTHLRALPMSALRTAQHISLIYITYRRPASVPVVYTLQEDRDSLADTREIADKSAPDDYSGLTWGTHSFAVEPDARRVTFVWGRPQKPALPLAGVSLRSVSYKPGPERVHMSFDLSRQWRSRSQDPSLAMPSWLTTSLRAANVGGDYSESSSQGLLQAGDGLAYQPLYTLWATAGVGPANRRLYGGLVAETMMVFHDSTSNMNWGTSYGAGAGIHMEWPN